MQVMVVVCEDNIRRYNGTLSSTSLEVKISMAICLEVKISIG